MSPRNAGLWLALIQEGLAADRPTIPNLPPNTGGFYIATDTGVISVWSNAQWNAFGQTGSTTGVTFAALPASPYIGQVAFITDAASTVLGANAAGAGAGKVLVAWNGTHWVVGGGATLS